MYAKLQRFHIAMLSNERLGLWVLGAGMLVIMLLMGLFTLTVLNSKSTKGYVLNQLEQTRQELVVDGEVMDTLNLRARSLTSIEEQSIGMIKPGDGDLVYVTPLTVVAQR